MILEKVCEIGRSICNGTCIFLSAHILLENPCIPLGGLNPVSGASRVQILTKVTPLVVKDNGQQTIKDTITRCRKYSEWLFVPLALQSSHKPALKV
jgi:hypothetical protein